MYMFHYFFLQRFDTCDLDFTHWIVIVYTFNQLQYTDHQINSIMQGCRRNSTQLTCPYELFLKSKNCCLDLKMCVCEISCSVILDSCNPRDCSLPGSSIHEILQARILQWVAIFFSRGPSRPRNQTWVSCIAGRFFTNWAMREALI